MRVLIQRCTEASVAIKGEIYSSIGPGMVVLLGIEDSDGDEDIQWLCRKIVALRIFDDAEGVMNLPITAVQGGDILLVSQFTLMASTKKGNRPSYVRASKPSVALPLYQQFISCLEHEFGGPVATGQFGANMQVSLTNDGPVTIFIDSHHRD